MLYSFDVFDTIITRNTAKPVHIFRLMQNVLQNECSHLTISKYVRDNFVQLRIHAEELARFHNMTQGMEEVTLEDIYEALAMSGNLSIDIQGFLCQLERKIEIENVIPIYDNIQRIKELLKQGERVVLISDMYLDKQTIRDMLQKADGALKRLPLYLSSFCGKRKTTGNLFRYVKEKEQISCQEWHHVGDNVHQDVQVPQSLGIFAEKYVPYYLDSMEKKLSAGECENQNATTLLAAARRTRVLDNSKEIAFKMGNTYGAPILYSYVSWILAESIEKGIKRLYFIARDGYLLKKIADEIIAAKKYEIQTHYIYGSRKAWRFVSLSEDCFNFYQLVSWSFPERITTVRKFADVIEIPVDELIPFLPYGCGYSEASLSEYGLNQIALLLEDNVDFKKFYLDFQRDRRNLAVTYLKQEIDSSDDCIAFVDVAGGGLTQGCLRNLMNDFYQKDILTFFFKLDRVNLISHCIYDVFLPSYVENNLVIEMLCRAPHGQTVGYRREDERVLPVLEQQENQVLIDHGFYDFEEGILEFVRSILYLEQLKGYQFEADTCVALKYLHYIAAEPNQETLDFFATLPNSDSGLEKKVFEYAPRLSKEDILNIFVRRTTQDISEYYHGSNLGYSILRCSEEERKFLEKCRKEYQADWAIEERKKAKPLLPERQYGRAKQFPCELLQKKIVIYGAGKFGQDLYRKIKETTNCEIVAWVDKNGSNMEKIEGCSIDAPEILNQIFFQQLIIAVMNEQLAGQIKDDLIRLGVRMDTIMWCKPWQKVHWEVEYHKRHGRCRV